jgi:hypothetical protein
MFLSIGHHHYARLSREVQFLWLFCEKSEMNPISPSSVHALPAHSSKVRLATKAEPSSGTLDNTEICSTSNQATLKSKHTKNNADPIMEKEHAVELPLLAPTSVLGISSTEVCPETRSRSSSLNLFHGKCKLASLQPEINMPKSRPSTTQEPCVELSHYSEAAPSTNELHKKPYQPESKTTGPCVDLSNEWDDVPSTNSHMRNERQTDQETSSSSDMPSSTVIILTVIFSILFIDAPKIIRMHFLHLVPVLGFCDCGLIKGPKSIDFFLPSM